MKYVFEEYRDKAGTGSEKVFDTEEQALAYANAEWHGMVEADHKSYFTDSAPVFHIYEANLTNEQVSQYNEGDFDGVLGDYWVREVRDYLKDVK
jgi:hypothetical protein